MNRVSRKGIQEINIVFRVIIVENFAMGMGFANPYSDWALPFEDHTPPMEYFGIPTKINVLTNSRSRQNSTVYMAKSYGRFWNPNQNQQLH